MRSAHTQKIRTENYQAFQLLTQEKRQKQDNCLKNAASRIFIFLTVLMCFFLIPPNLLSIGNRTRSIKALEVLFKGPQRKEPPGRLVP